MNRIRLVQLVSPILLASLLAGCGGGQARLSNDLKQFGLAYVSYQDDSRKAPAGWQDLQPFLEGDTQKQLEAAGYTVIWGLKIEDAKQGTGDTIVAHPANAADGGLVCFLDGGVREQTGDEITKKLAAQKAE
jgi:hypothetical protein